MNRWPESADKCCSASAGFLNRHRCDGCLFLLVVKLETACHNNPLVERLWSLLGWTDVSDLDTTYILQ